MVRKDLDWLADIYWVRGEKIYRGQIDLPFLKIFWYFIQILGVSVVGQYGLFGGHPGRVAESL